MKFDKIEELYAWISHDKDGEGLCGAVINGAMMPLIGADKKRIKSLRAYALGASTIKKVKLVKFSKVTVLEVVDNGTSQTPT